MSLQDIVDWWNDWVKNKQAIPSCGAWPMSIPPIVDIFLDCCIVHDFSYQESEVIYAQGVIERNEALKKEGLRIKSFADNKFILCVKTQYNSSYFFTRPFTKKWGEWYIDVVLANGDRIWFHSIGVIIAEWESGNTPTIQLALHRAKSHGTYQEEAIHKQALSLSGETKARN